MAAFNVVQRVATDKLESRRCLDVDALYVKMPPVEPENT